MRDPRWIVAFPLDDAVLCVNCENVSNRVPCIVCQSEQVIPLARILNRKGENDEPERRPQAPR